MYSSSLWTWNMYDWHVFWKWHEKIQGAWDCWIAIIPLKSMISVASIQVITARWKENNWNGGTLKKTPIVITKSMSFLRPAVWKNGSPIFRCQWLLQEESATSPIILWRRYSVTDEYRCVRTLRGCSLPGGGGGSSAFWTLTQIMPNFRPQNGCLWIAKPPTFPPHKKNTSKNQRLPLRLRGFRSLATLCQQSMAVPRTPLSTGTIGFAKKVSGQQKYRSRRLLEIEQ